MPTTIETAPLTEAAAERLSPGDSLYLFPATTSIGSVWRVREVDSSPLGIELTIEHPTDPDPHSLFVSSSTHHVGHEPGSQTNAPTAFPLIRLGEDEPRTTFHAACVSSPGGEERTVETFWGSTLSLTALVPDEANHELFRARVEALLRAEFPGLYLPEVTSAAVPDERVDVYADQARTQLLARNVLKATMHYLPFSTRDVHTTRPFQHQTPAVDAPDGQSLLDAQAAARTDDSA